MGEVLIDNLIELTNLPQESLRKEISRLIDSSGKTINEINLEDLRQILAAYLQDVLSEAKEHLS